MLHLFNTILSWFWPPPAPVFVPVPEMLSEAPARDAEPEDPLFRYDRAGVEQGGAFYFKRAILDNLKNYFNIIRRFRRADPDAYGMYSKIGAVVVPRSMLAIVGGLPDAWAQRSTQELRSFGCLWFGHDEGDDDEMFYPQFAYYQKLKHAPHNGEPSNGAIYHVVLYYDTIRTPPRWLRKCGYVIEFHVAVEDGAVRLLKRKETFIGHSKRRVSSYVGITNAGHAKGAKVESKNQFTYQKWIYPRAITELWDDVAHRPINDGKFVDVNHYAAHYFQILASYCDADMAGGIRVLATRGEESATFNVDYKRTAYFFKDRETTLNAKGSKARIFHIVRPHIRVAAGGAEKAIKLHFRGLRQFEWNGYQILITVPGKHHAGLDRFNAGALIEGEGEPVVGNKLNMPQLGDFIRKTIRGAEAPPGSS